MTEKKTHSFKCGDDKKNKLKGVSKSFSKNIEVEDFENCLDGEDYQQESNIYISKSINHEMHLQKIKKNLTIYFGR